MPLELLMPRPAEASSYAAVLHLHGARRAFAAATTARLSYAMVTLTILLVVQQATDSYTVAGAAVAGYGLTTLLMPLKSRLVDRRGAASVLPWLSVGFAGCVMTLSAVAVAGSSAKVLYVLLAVGAGLLAPPVGPTMRALWAAMTPDARTKRRAYSLDAAVEEVMFATGPLLVGAALLVASSTAAGLVTAALNLLGTLALVTSPASRTQDRLRAAPTTSRRWTGPLSRRGFVVLLVVLLGMGVATGPLEVGLLARAEQTGTAARVGVLLAALAVGSAFGGIAWGQLVRTHRPRAHLAGLVALSAVLLAALVPSSNAWLLTGLLLLIGLAASPMFITAYVTADELARTDEQREASTWVSTANNLGIALGASVAGVLADRSGPGSVFAAGALACLLVLVVVGLLGRRLEARSVERPEG